MVAEDVVVVCVVVVVLDGSVGSVVCVVVLVGVAVGEVVIACIAMA